MKDRCFVVYALAPTELGAREANDALNQYIGDARRGVPVFHDHFTGRPHGGVAVFHVRDETERAMLDDAGALEGWAITSHALVFALTPAGFAAQTEFTLEAYGGTSLDAARDSEGDDPRYWWRDRDDAADA